MVFCVLASSCFAEEFNYFKDSKESQSSQSDTLDPSNPEFFREGTYVPPKVFVDVISNPSDDNISRWLEYNQTKVKLQEQLQKRIQEFVSKNPTKPNVLQSESSATSTALDLKRFNVELYFDTKCPHCHKLIEVLLRLKTNGLTIESFQIDQEPLARMPFKNTIATHQKRRSLGIESVPFLLIKDRETRKDYSLTGFRTFEELSEVFLKLQRKEPS